MKSSFLKQTFKFLLFTMLFLFVNDYSFATDLPDYTLTDVNIAPAIATSGVTPVYAYCKVKNVGNTYSGRTVLTLYLTQDTTSSGGTGFALDYFEALQAGYSTTEKRYSDTLDLPAGDYYLAFKLSMRDDDKESDTTNNLFFQPIKVLSNITVINNSYGTVSGLKTAGYSKGDTVSLKATPNVGSLFLGWVEGSDTISTNPVLEFTAVKNRTLTAVFKPKDIQVKVTCNPTAGGKNSVNTTYPYGTSLTLTAQPNTGYAFVNWTVKDTVASTNTAYTFTVTDSVSIIANFKKIYTITAGVYNSVGGTVSGSGTYSENDVVTLTATPDAGYKFLYWCNPSSGTIYSTSKTYIFSATKDLTIKAYYANKFYITVAYNVVNRGDIKIGARNITEGGYFGYDSTFTVTATPYEGYEFQKWMENDTVLSTQNPFDLKVESDRALTVYFVPKTYSIVAEAGTGGTATGSRTYSYGSTVTVRATPSTGYSFVNWTENGTAVSSSASYSFTASAARTLKANFAINSYDITLSASTGGSVSGDGTYNYGTSQTVTATPSTGYKFVSWTEGSTVVSTSASYTFNVTATRTLKANFTAITCKITLLATTGGSVSGGGTYNYGLTKTFTATPSTGYEFVSWTQNGTVIYTGTSLYMKVTEDMTLTANFSATTGLAETTRNINYNVYPNPATDFVIVTFNEPNIAGKRVVALLYDPTGKAYAVTIASKDESSIKIKLPKLPAGVYYLALSIDENKIPSKKIMVTGN